MDKYSNQAYKDKVIINGTPPRDWVRTMASCVLVVIVRRTLPVMRTVQVSSLRCQPALIG